MEECHLFKILQMVPTAWKMSLFGVFLVCIFSHLDWIGRDTQYSVQMREKMDQKNPEYGHFSRSNYMGLLLNRLNEVGENNF